MLLFSSVQFSCSVVSDFLQPCGLQHTRLPCPSPTPGACSNSCTSSQWCHPAISSSVVPFSSCLQSFPASGSFPMSQFFRWPKCSSFIFSISPSNEYSGLISFRIDWLNLFAIQGTLKSLLQHWRWRRKERYTHLNAEFQRIKRKGKKAFVSDQCKEIEENNRTGKTRDLFKKIKDTKGTFNQRRAQ